MPAFRVKGILSYPHLFTPRAVQQGDDPKFGVVVLLRDTDPQLQQILALQDQEKKNGFPSGFPNTGKVFCKPSPDYPGWHQISGGAKADQRPAVVDEQFTPVSDPGRVFAGMVAHVSFNTFTYSTPVNKGVSAGLNGVMITNETGELGRIDGRPSVEAMFAGVGSDPVGAPFAAPSMPPSPPAPPAPPAAPVRLMTPKAGGVTYEAYIANGWTDALLIEHGMMTPGF
jgi:hypothetical protein